MTTMTERLARRLTRRFRKSERGTAAVEFAFVAAPFLYLLMAIFETGLMLFAEFAIENGTAQAARMIRTGQVQDGNINKAGFKTLVCGKMASFLDCSGRLYVDVRKWKAFKDVDQPAGVSDKGEVSDDVSTNSKFEPGGPMEVVTVRVYYDWQLFTPGITYLQNMSGGRRLLTAGAAFRNEPFGN